MFGVVFVGLFGGRTTCFLVFRECAVRSGSECAVRSGSECAVRSGSECAVRSGSECAVRSGNECGDVCVCVFYFFDTRNTRRREGTEAYKHARGKGPRVFVRGLAWRGCRQSPNTHSCYGSAWARFVPRLAAAGRVLSTHSSVHFWTAQHEPSGRLT